MTESRDPRPPAGDPSQLYWERYQQYLRDRHNRSIWRRWARSLHLQLIVPVLRNRNAPTLTARSVMVGVVVGMTPTQGFQTPLLVAMWWVARLVGWRFSFIIAYPWNIITNPFTMGPLYYVWYLVGMAMLGDLGTRLDLESFVAIVERSMAMADQGFLENAGEALRLLWNAVGLPVCLGSVPFAVGFGWFSYVLTRRLLTNRLRRKGISVPEG